MDSYLVINTYFPRYCKMNLRDKIYSQIAKARNACLQKKDQEGFRVRFISDYIGSGVFCEKSFAKGDFLLEYRGELISGSEGANRDKNYPDTKGSFLYFFQHGGKSKCVDGTASDGRGRMVNDSHKNANCKMKVVLIQDVPRLCLFAIKDLKKGDELRCDYGVQDLPWRKKDESNSSVLSHDPPSDSESCDTPCDVSNHHKRNKKSQNATKMESSAPNLPNLEVIIKVEPPEETPDSFDSNIDNGGGFAFPVLQPSSQEASSSIFDYAELVSSNLNTDQSGSGNTDADNATSIPDPVDLQSFIQSHTVGSQEGTRLKTCHISVPFIQFESNPNLNLTDSRQSNEDEGNKEGSTASSDNECYNDNVDETHYTIAPDVVPKTEPEDNGDSNNYDSNDGGDLNIAHQHDQSTGESSESVSAPMDTSNNELPSRPHGPKKAPRKCPFCLQFRAKLSRHIKHMHKDLRRVQEAMMLPAKEQQLAFALMRKEGILIANMQRMKETNNPVFERERRKKVNDSPVVVCSLCKGFYSEASFERHKCEAKNQGDCHPIPVSVIASQNPENNDAGAHDPPSDNESCGLCCEEEQLPRPRSDDLHYGEEHTLVGSDDLLVCFEEGHMYESNDDLCSEEGYTSISSDDLCSEDEHALVGSDDLLMCSKEGHTRAGSNDLCSKEGHTHAGSNDLISKEGHTHAGSNDLCSKEGHTHAGSNDLCFKEGHTHAGSNDLCFKEGHTHAGSNDLCSKEGHTHAGSNDLISKEGLTNAESNYLHSKEGHTNAGSNDLHSKEGHSHAGSDKSQLQKPPPTTSYKNMQEEAYTEPETNNSHNLSEKCDASERTRVTEIVTVANLTQDSHQSSKKKISKSSSMHSKHRSSPRKCPFCLNLIKGRLRKHIESAHVDMRQVKDALELPEKEQKVAFALMRKAGILLAKKEKMNQSKPDLEREHRARTGGSMVLCGGCKGLYSYRSFWRHKIQCQRSVSSDASSGPLSLVASQLESKAGNSQFKHEILHYLPTDEISDLCRSDPTLLLLGKRWWRERTKLGNGRTYIRKTVMSDMRKLATLYKNFEKQQRTRECGVFVGQGTVRDMFDEQNFLSLCEAVNIYTRDVESSTAKVKLLLFFLLKKACKVIKASYVAEGKHNACAKMDRFMAVLVQNSNFIVGEGGNQVMPSGGASPTDAVDLSMEDDIRKLRNHFLNEMTSLLRDASMVWNANNLKKLRDMTVLRLTMLNARRAGGEPCRLTVQEFQERCPHALTDNQEVGSSNTDLLEKDLLENWTTIYQTSLGHDRLVPVSIPPDCLWAMVILTSRDKRELAGVLAGNPYIFACMKGSEHHASVWHVLNDLCNEAEIDKEAKLRAAENYQWVCLLYASMELSEPDQNSTFNKMRHTFDVNDAPVMEKMEALTIDPNQAGKGQKRKQSDEDEEADPQQTKRKPPESRQKRQQSDEDEEEDAQQTKRKPPERQKRQQSDEDEEEDPQQTKRKPPETQKLLSAHCNMGHRPARHCPYCSKTFAGSQLSRHIRRVHKDLDDVKYAVKQPHHNRNKCFAQMKKLGIYKLNVRRVKEGSKSLVMLRGGATSPAVICKHCKGTYSKMNFRKHKCGLIKHKESAEEVSILQSFLKVQREDPHFANSVLSKILHSKIGKACIADEDIRTVGRWIWNTKRVKTQTGVKTRSEVLKVMRHLTVLKGQFEEEMVKSGKEIGRSITTEMFCSKNFDVLKIAVLSVVSKTGQSGTEGVKQELIVLIKKAAAILEATRLIQEDDEKAKEIEQFLAIFDEWKDSIVGGGGQEDRNTQVGNEDQREPSLEGDTVKTGGQCLDKRGSPNKEVDHIAQLLKPYVKAPNTKGKKDRVTMNKEVAANTGESGMKRRAKQMPLRKRSKVQNQDFATFEDSESDEEVGQDTADKEFSLSDRKGKAEGKGKKQKWSEHATKLIHDHFKTYICTAGDINRGKLPGKEEIKAFLKKNREVLREIKSVDRKVLLVKTKVFNERNSYRRNLLAKD